MMNQIPEENNQSSNSSKENDEEKGNDELKSKTSSYDFVVSTGSFAYTREMLPRRIMKNGQFFENKSSSGQILLIPNVAESTFEDLWKIICRRFKSVSSSSSHSKFSNETDSLGANRNSTDEFISDQTTVQKSFAEDVEAQHPNLVHHEDQEDGIYVPGLIDSTFKHAYRSEILSRLERDKLDYYEEKCSHEYYNMDKSALMIFNRPQDSYSDYFLEKKRSIPECNSVIDDSAMILIVQIVQVKIYDHPNFIEEERLVHKIEILHDKMVALNDVERMKNFEVRLNAIISAILELDNIESESKTPEAVDTSRYSILYEDFLQIVSKIVNLEYEVYSLYCGILKIWDNVIKIRQYQGFQSTSSMLVKVANISGDSCAVPIGNQMKRFQQHCDELCSSLVPNSLYQSIQDAIEAYNFVQMSRKSRLIIALKKGDETMISNASSIAPERRRRENIRSEFYEAKLFVDGKFVDATSKVRLEWPSMLLRFDQAFELAVQGECPKVCVHISKTKIGLLDEVVSKVYVSFPGQATFDEGVIDLDLYSPCYERYHFSNTQKSSNSRNVNVHKIEGAIFVRTFWRRVKLSSALRKSRKEKQVQKPNLNSFSSRQILIGGEQRKRQATQRRNKDSFLYRLKPSVHAALSDSSLRYLYEGSRHSYYNSRRLKEPVRHKLMKHRQNNKFLSNDYIIPLDEKDVTIEDIERVADSNQLSQKSNEIVEQAIGEHMLADPKNVSSFILLLRSFEKKTRNWNRCTMCAFEDIVHDISHIRGQAAKRNLSWIFAIFNPPRIRSLMPDRINLTTPSNSACSIFITIISASNVQQREEALNIDHHRPFLVSPPIIKRISTDLPFLSPSGSLRLNFGDDYNLTTNKKNTTKSFVRIRFQDKVFYTRVEVGDSPIWEQRFEIPLFDKETDNSCISPSMLKVIEDDIEIILFDRVDMDIGQGGGFFDDEDTYIQDRRYLGSMTVPLEKIFSESRVKGHQLLQTPDVIIGYKSKQFTVPFLNGPHCHSENVERDDHESQRVDGTSTKRSCTTLNLLISMGHDVAFAQEPALCNGAPTNEIPSVTTYALEWMDGIFKVVDAPINKKLYDILVAGSNGKTWLLNRFLHSQKPPDSCKLSQYRCAHFVSLLPRLDAWSSFKSLKRSHNFWLSSQKFLDILAGNWSEHAVLLANYFLYLSDVGSESTKTEVFLVIGSTITESKVVYVMTRSLSDGKKRFWDPVGGLCFETDDVKCPLTNIGLLVTIDNMFANLRPSIHPCFLDLDFFEKRKWKPFYNLYTRPKSLLNPVQEHELKYFDPNPILAKELEIEIFNKIKISMRCWRRTSCIFNSDVGKRSRFILEELEEHKLNGTTYLSSSEYQTSLFSACSRGKVLYGFPLHFAFINIQKILDEIEMTGIHQSKHPEGEFALAVKVYPYECGAMSVWVFVCHIAPDHFV